MSIEPTCPKCESNSQVWTNQISGNKTCHRVGCGMYETPGTRKLEKWRVTMYIKLDKYLEGVFIVDGEEVAVKDPLTPLEANDISEKKEGDIVRTSKAYYELGKPFGYRKKKTDIEKLSKLFDQFGIKYVHSAPYLVIDKGQRIECYSSDCELPEVKNLRTLFYFDKDGKFKDIGAFYTFEETTNKDNLDQEES